jgi:omega-amidase
MKITIVQNNIQWEDKKANLIHLAEMISGINEPTDLIILPETFNTGFSMNTSALAEEMGSDTCKWMQDIVSTKNYAVCGSIFIREEGRFYNRFLFIDNSGRTVTYNKRHLFSIGGEDKNFTRGNNRTVFEYQGIRLNTVICYDLRFPVWLRNQNDYDLLICVANWPDSRRDVWKTLLKARAIENQAYVAGVNCIGVDNAGNRCIGESVVFDPRGNAILTLPENREGIGSVDISLNELLNFRKKFPVWKDADDFLINT